MMFKKLIYLLLILVMFACQSGKDHANEEFIVPDSILDAGALEISDEAMSEIIENVSSPVEVAALLNDLGVPFSNKYLSDTKNMKNYTTNFQKAFNLGVYGADMGYLNIYNKTSTVIDYLSTIKDLAEELKVGQFFDFQTLKRLATNSQNLDSLMYLSVNSFNKMDQYLKENNRSNISSLIVAGIWMEGMYLVTQVAKTHPVEEIIDRVGEQKIILDDLLLILKNYKNDTQFQNLIGYLNELKILYNDITIKTIAGEAEAVEKNGRLVITQHDESIVEMTDDQLKSIIDKMESIRNKLIQY